MRSPSLATTSGTPSGVKIATRAVSMQAVSPSRQAPPGYNSAMEQKPAPLRENERTEVIKEAVDAHEGDKKLDEYDKEVADSFPASDPPAQP